MFLQSHIQETDSSTSLRRSNFQVLSPSISCVSWSSIFCRWFSWLAASSFITASLSANSYREKVVKFRENYDYYH